MDDDSLGAALDRATDDVEVPRDLVRRAQRLGRERRARRRSGIAALGVAVVVLVGGGLVVMGQQGGDGATSGSAAGEASSATPVTPESMQDALPRDGEDSSTCAPTLLLDGVPQGEGAALTPVRAGEALDVTGGPLSCRAAVPGARYEVVLAPQEPGEPAVLAGVTVADDGSFAVRVTVPASTPPGPAALSVTAIGSAAQACGSAAGCAVPDYRADLDVRPTEESP